MITKKINRKLEVIDRCNLCKSADNSFFIQGINFTGRKEIFNYVKCNKCGLIWLSPRPKQKYIGEYYYKGYSAYITPKKVSSLIKLIRSLIYSSPLAGIFIKDKLFPLKGKGKILDVGTGNGRYLDILKDWGYEVFGVEVNKQCVGEMKQRGLNVKKGDLYSAKYPANFFDIVRFSHVMEHVHSPLSELKETRRILKKNGFVVILIPNIDSLFFKIFRHFWYPLEAPRHLYHYSPITIKKLLVRSGFKKIEISFNQSPYTVIRSIMYFFNKTNANGRYGLFVYPLALILRILNQFKVSDTLEIWARK